MSDWVAVYSESDIPEDAQVLSRKYSYTETMYTKSTSTVLEGWTEYKNEWVKSNQGSFNYASFPNGFDTGNSYYKNWNRSPYSKYETETTKREVENVFGGYIYWHWMYDCGNSNAYYRDISNVRGYGAQNGYGYWYFGAFSSTADAASEGNSWNNGCGLNVYYVSGRTSYADTQGSWYWFRFNYNICYFTDYYKLFYYTKTAELESTTGVTAGTTDDGNVITDISNVVEWVQYRVK